MLTKDELELVHNALAFQISVTGKPDQTILNLQAKVARLIKELET